MKKEKPATLSQPVSTGGSNLWKQGSCSATGSLPTTPEEPVLEGSTRGGSARSDTSDELDWNVFERAGSLPRSRSSNFWESLFSQGSANIEAEQSSEGSSRRRSDDDMLRFSEGDVLARQGEHDGDGAFFIVEGQVEAVLELPDGTECVVDVHPANSYAAELCPFGMVPRQPVTYRARTETVKAHWLSTACLNALLERKTSFAQCTNAIPHKARQQRPSLFSVQNKLKAIERAGQSTDSKGDEEAHGRSEDT